MNTSRRILFSTMVVLLLVILVEPLSFFAGKYLEKKNLFYTPAMGSDYQSYLASRDPVVGWPPPGAYGTGDRDHTGSRRIPAFIDPDENPSCISLYGNSFTWGSDVTDEFAWSNLLAKLSGCRVANYGVGGYGTDQAFLRFRHNTHDDAKIVILGYLSENIMRNINQFRDLIYAHGGFGFKPRFAFDEEGRLTLIRLPDIAENEYARFVDHPERYLQHEYFVPGGPSGVRRLEFPYTWSILTSFRHFIVQTKIKGAPWYADFYQMDHPSKALPITTEIIRMFVEEARARERIPLVVFFPTVLDLLFFQKNQAWVYQHLIDRLNASGIECLNIGPAMMEYLEERGPDPWQLFNRHSAHYNKTGYRIVAESVHQGLLDRELLP